MLTKTMFLLKQIKTAIITRGTMSRRQAVESTSEEEEDYFGIFGEEPEKGESALALTICSMYWQKIDEATKLELQEIRRAINARFASKKSSEKKKTIRHGNKIAAPKKQSKHHSKGRKYKVSLLGKNVEGCELPILPPGEKLIGIVGRCSRPFEKELTASDVDTHNSRLALVRRYAIETILPLLNEEEKEQLDSKGMGAVVEVDTFDEEGKKYGMEFSKWADGKFYVLKGTWNAFLMDHSLKCCEDLVAVWSFRHLETGKLCFVVASRKNPSELQDLAMLCDTC